MAWNYGASVLLGGGSLLIFDTDGGSGRLIVFAVTRDGAELTAEAGPGVRSLLRAQLSPRRQPDLVRRVAAVPRTLTGRRMEVPVKRVLLDRGAAAPAEPGEPDPLADFRALGRQLATARQGARRVSVPRAT